MSEQFIGRKEIGDAAGRKMGSTDVIVLYWGVTVGYCGLLWEGRKHWRGRSCSQVVRSFYRG